MLLALRYLATRDAYPVERHTALSQLAFVDGHAYRRVHCQPTKGSDFATCFDAAGGDDGVAGGGTKMAKPLEIGASHGPFAIDISAKKRGAVRFELWHYLSCLKFQASSPAVCDDPA